MRYIVLYILTFWLLFVVEIPAQKPAISLIPSKVETIHPEAMIDTTLTSDSLIQVIPVALDSAAADSPGKQIPSGPARSTTGSRERRKGEMHSLFGMKNSLLRFFIHVTVLNI